MRRPIGLAVLTIGLACGRVAAARGRRTRRNDDDRIFRRGGDRLLLAPEAAQDGYAADFSLGLQLE